jgi:hypothetical protein
VVRIEATPSSEADGAKLADAIIARLAVVTSDGDGSDGARARLPRRRPPVEAGWCAAPASRGAKRSCRGSSCGSGACARRSRPC